MTGQDRTHERIRWRCRRGMLELDLVLRAFVERYLERLDARELDAFTRLLDRSDPELLDLAMGREEGRDASEREVLALIRAAQAQTDTLTRDASRAARGEICGAAG